MLRALEIENFKGIAARQRVDFGPLTLLFGANSAGKSTVLQALLYLHELLERGTADVDRTELGGNVLELGGFARLVHRHEANRAIILRAEFATPGGLERFGRDLADFPFPDLDDEVESAWLELTIKLRTTATFRGPLVERAIIGVGGDSEPLVWLETGVTLREGEPLNARVNLGHRLIAEGAREISDAWRQIAVPEEALQRTLDAEEGGNGGGFGLGDGLGDALMIGNGRSLPVFAISRSRISALPSSSESLRVISFGDDNKEKAAASAQVRTFLEMVVLGTTAQLVASLRDSLYIGPLRTIPPRGFLYERAGRITGWADGLAAWDLLLADRTSLVERTNLWLRRLGAGCQVVVQQLFDRTADAELLSDGHVDKAVRRLLLDTGAGSLVLPSEVGAGVSQIIPVVVAALEARAGLSLIEQPEIHVHPAVQVGLGDLFIDAATRDRGRRTVLVETHSEHLILRLLRRIRETTDNKLVDGSLAFSADKISVLYVESSSEGMRIHRLHVDERGEFTDRWPKGFFDERFAEVY
ncbi:MAG: DUF3696 domain-containing protein [Myxococcaceae bacterium]|nr:MAG: DUF3696 domain-containing protein [Myxococcaceae bacterium]